MIGKFYTTIAMIALIFGIFGCKESKNPETWSDKKLDEWFNKGEWLSGWSVRPDNSADKRAFAVNYFKNKERWDKAFSFFKNSDLLFLETGRHNIDGDNLYALVSEYLTKDESEARFESHRKYVDIQYVVKGKEIIQITPIEMRDTVFQEYDESKDIEFFSVKEHNSFIATPDKFFIFFPSDAHRPGLKIDAADSVRKVVIKLRID